MLGKTLIDGKYDGKFAGARLGSVRGGRERTWLGLLVSDRNVLGMKDGLGLGMGLEVGVDEGSKVGA